MSFKTYTLQVPATNADVAMLMQVILKQVSDLDERVQLLFGTSQLLASDERERQENRETVTVREALIVLTATIIPGDE